MTETFSNDVPGPGQYDVQGKMMPNARQAPSYSMAKRFWKDDNLNRNPGPGQYNCPEGLGKQNVSNKSSCKRTKFGKSKRWMKGIVGNDVGPGQYKTSSTVGRQFTSVRKSAPMWVFGTGPQRGKGRAAGGAPYVGASNLIGTGTPAISISGREKFGSTTFGHGGSPGPGAYDPKGDGRAGTAKIRGWGFGSQSRLPKVKLRQSPGPGEYLPPVAKTRMNSTWTQIRLRQGMRSRR